jgi:hypothetical protein
VTDPEGEWVLQTLVWDYSAGEPGFTDDGEVTGRPKAEDIELLMQALAKLGEATGRALDEVQVPPSQFTVEGHVAVQVSEGHPTVVQFGAQSGVSVSMTWQFQQCGIRPLGIRKP